MLGIYKFLWLSLSPVSGLLFPDETVNCGQFGLTSFKGNIPVEFSLNWFYFLRRLHGLQLVHRWVTLRSWFFWQYHSRELPLYSFYFPLPFFSLINLNQEHLPCTLKSLLALKSRSVTVMTAVVTGKWEEVPHLFNKLSRPCSTFSYVLLNWKKSKSSV